MSVPASRGAVSGRGRVRRRLWLALPLFAVAGTNAAPAAGPFECTVLRQDAGRARAAMEAPLQRRADVTLQLIEIGDTYYTGDDPGRPGTVWLELFGGQSQRGNTFVGYFLGENLRCRPY
jgi:hypothetical protein